MVGCREREQEREGGRHNSISLYGGERGRHHLVALGEGEAHLSRTVFIILTQKPTFDQVIRSLFEDAIFNWKHLLSFVHDAGREFLTP